MVTLLLLYFRLIGCSLIGLLYQMMNKYKSIKEKAKLANVQYPTFFQFLLEDKTSWILTLATISFMFLLLGATIDPKNLALPTKPIEVFWIFSLSAEEIYVMVLCLLFATCGYMGVDIFLRLMSKTNSRINAAIDYKTTQADKAAGTLDQPTPATK